jgi:predicted secreted hydrolase
VSADHRTRRAWLRGTLATCLSAASPRIQAVDASVATDVLPGVALRFPRDHGSHPAFRTEWWYITGWLRDERETLGFQITFFRTHGRAAAGNPSRFAARQLLIGHAAIADPARARLWKAQRLVRAGFDLAEARDHDTQVWIDDWHLRRSGDVNASEYRARMRDDEFAFDLRLSARAAPLLNGDEGYSRKGPAPLSASYYYSVPQLAVQGSVERRGRRTGVAGHAWLDHEWSSAYLDSEATGWDWFAVNLGDGGALMAFRIRDRAGDAHWAGATWRSADGTSRRYPPEALRFESTRSWRSGRSGVSWPVAWRVRIANDFDLTLAPLFDDQESDTRASTGAIYWEGAVTAQTAAGVKLGEGYLELTGYGSPLRLP